MRPAAASILRLTRSKPAKVGVVVATAAAATALGVGVASSSGSKGRTFHAATHAATSPTPTQSPTNVTRTAPSTTTTTVDSVPPGVPVDVPATGLGVGSKGPAVAAIRQRLTDLRYDPGAPGDHFDYTMYYAVVAFQKLRGMPRTGRVTPDLAAAMATAGLPAPLEPAAEPNRVEIDLTHQVLVFWQDQKVLRILPVSTGFGGHYCGEDGSCGIAVTPTGAFHATSKIRGAHKSTLGELWDPVFFNGGIAIHGEPSVPGTPASHGCVRIPMNDSVWMYNTLALGTPVYVLDSTHIPVPFNQGGKVGPGQPGGTPPTIPHPTTTKPPTATTAAPGAPTTTVLAPSTTVKPTPTTLKPAPTTTKPPPTQPPATTHATPTT